MTAWEQKLRELDQNPDFQKMSYGAQKEVRRSWVLPLLQAESTFQKLSPAAQEEVVNSWVNSRPAFVNNTFPEMTDLPALEEDAKKGGRSRALPAVRAWSAMNEMTSAKAVLGIVSGALKPMLKALSPDPQLVENASPEKIMYGPDTVKAADYLSELSGRASSASTSSMIGKFLDLGVYMSTGRGPSAALGKIAGTLSSGLSSQLGRFAVAQAAPAVVRALAGGGVSAAREAVDALQTGKELTGDALLTAGTQGVVFDAAVNMLMASVPYVKANLWIFGKGVTREAVKAGNVPSPEEYVELVRRVANGASPKEVAAAMDPLIVEHLEGLREYDVLSKMKPSEFLSDPTYFSKATAFENSMTAVDLPDGRIRLRAWPNVQKADWGREGGEIIGEYDNVVDLNRAIAGENRKITDAVFEELKNKERKLATLTPDVPEYRDVEQRVLSLREALVRSMKSGEPLKPYLKLPEQVDNAFGEAVTGSKAKSISTRGAISQGEFSDELARMKGGSVVAVPAQVAPSPAQMKELRRGGRLFETDIGVNLKKYDGPDPNVLVVLTNPADEAKVLRAAEDLKKVGATNPAALQDYLVQSGYDGITHTDGSVTSFFPRNQVKYVSDFVSVKTGKLDTLPPGSVLRGVKTVGQRATGEAVTAYVPKDGPSPIRDPRAVEIFGKENFIKQEVRAFVPDRVLKESDSAIARILGTVSGNTAEHTDKIRKAVSLLAERAGLSEKDVIVKTLAEASADAAYVRRSGNALTVFVPEKIRGAYEQAQFVRALLGKMDEEVRAGGYVLKTKSTPEAFSILEAVLPDSVRGSVVQKLSGENRFLPPVQDKENALEWFNGMVRDVYGSDVKAVPTQTGMSYVIRGRRPGESDIVFNTLEDAVDDVLLRQVSLTQLRTDLGSQGFKVRSGKDGITVFDGKSILARGDTVQDVLKKLEYRPSKIDGRFSPQDVRVVEGGVEFKIRGNAAVGKMRDVNRFLDRFADPAADELSKTVARSAVGKIAENANATYDVSIPAFGIRRTFKDAKSAQEFLRGKWADADTLMRMAGDRGFDLTRRGGLWILQNEAGTRSVKTLEEVGDVLKTVPDPSFAPALVPELEVDADLVKITEKIDSTYSTRPTFFVPHGADRVPTDELGPLEIASHAFRPQQRWIAEKLEKTGRKDLGELFQSLQTHVTEMRRVQNDVRANITELFKDVGGKKVIPAKRREGILQYMEAMYRESDEALRAKIVKESGLTEHDLRVAASCRDILGKSPTEGLNATFGVSAQKYLFDYMPRYRKWAAGNVDDVNSVAGSSATEVWKSKISGEGSIPKEVEFMSAYKRVEDTVDFTRETDALRVMLRYTDTGFKTKYLDPVWKKIDAAMKVGALNETLRMQMRRYQEVLFGSYLTSGEKKLAAFGEALHRKLGVNPEVGRKVLDAYFTLNVLTTQAFRPWLAIRNVSQTYTTLGALMGMDYTQRAMKEVMEDPERWVKLLQQYGLVGEAPPLVHELLRAEGEAATKFGAAIQAGENAMGIAAQKGLWSVKNGDDLTRAFAYVAAKTRFEDGVTRLQKGLFKDYASFSEFTNVNYMDDAVQKIVEEHVRAGRFDEARHEFGKNVVDLTMFSYAKQNRPGVMDGVVGRLYGQYQIYPFNYVELVRRMGKKGTVAQKAATLGRLVGIAGGIAAGLTAIGMEGSNFLPWMPASMSGGPLFNVAVNVAQATNASGYQGRQARAELGAMLPVQMNLQDFISGNGPLDASVQWPRTVPGFYQFDSLRKALKYAEDGNDWNAFLALTGAPIRMDLR